MKTEFTWEIHPYKIENVIKLIQNKKLILRPEYQRRSVWSSPAKSALIETIMQKKPIPLFLIQKKNTGILEVIDGQQRLRSILDFYLNKLKLINVDDNINGKNYSDFNPTLFSEYNYQELFNNYELYFNLIENANEDDIIDMYSRVNKYTVNLNKMEMKYALNHNSNLLKFIDNLTNNDDIMTFFLTTGIFTQSTVSRMGDIEFFILLIEYMISSEFSNKDDAINRIFEKYSSLETSKLDKLEEEFNETLKLIKAIFISDEFKVYVESKSDKSSEYFLKNTRFKQKNDFLSLFTVIFTLKDTLSVKLAENKSEISNLLIIMDATIAPQSDIEICSLYGVKCVSQANSKTSREFRSKFILEGFEHIFQMNLYEMFNFTNIQKLNMISQITNQINELAELEGENQLTNSSTFKEILDILWTPNVDN